MSPSPCLAWAVATEGVACPDGWAIETKGSPDTKYFLEGQPPTQDCAGAQGEGTHI